MPYSRSAPTRFTLRSWSSSPALRNSISAWPGSTFVRERIRERWVSSISFLGRRGYRGGVLEAAFWGLVGASSLVIGAALGLARRWPPRSVGLIMGFGAGTLISALAFELTEEAFKLGGADTVALGLAAGGITYAAGDYLIARRGAKRRMSAGGEQARAPGSALLLGAVLDGIPESAVLGITLLEGGKVSVAFLAAVFLSNLPEALSSASGAAPSPGRAARVLRTWTLVALVSALSAALGYGLLEGASDDLVGLIQAFAGGAVLTMLVDTMIPEAREAASGGPDGVEADRTGRHLTIAGRAVGLATVLGFAVAYLLSTLD